VSVHEGEDVLLARLHRLAPSLDGEPDPAFRAATRARLVAMAAVRSPAPVPASPLQRLLAARAPDAAPARWRTRLTAGIAGAALTVTALASLVAVADGARPGDALYGLKRGTEQTQLALAGEARGQTLLDFAGSRLDELAALVGPSDGMVSAAGADPGLVLETLRTMDEQTTGGAAWLTDRAVETVDTGPLDHLAQWAAGQSADLAGLQDLVPDAAAEAVGQSLALLVDVGGRADGLEAAFACPGGPSVDGTDDLGPLPAPCPAPVTTPPTTSGGTDPGTGSAEPGAGTTAPEPTPGVPTAPPTAVPGTGDGSTGLPTPALPAPVSPGGGRPPSLPVPLPLPVPRPVPLPLPLPEGSPQQQTPPTVIQVPPVGDATLCLPPLVTVGGC
jgi:hypothetical protein